MGYSHTFFAIDIAELKGLFGSKNDALLNEILKSQAADIEDNDAFFESDIEEGELSDTATALREIFYGNPRKDADGAIYGYALKIICQHVGEQIHGKWWDAADVSDHPYDSLLMKSGLPIPIPEPNDFPMMGYLDANQIDQELALAKSEHTEIASDSAKAKQAFREAVGIRKRGRGIIPQEIQDDIDSYVKTLEAAKKLGKGLVSFRH